MRPFLSTLCLLLSLSLSAPSAACINESPEAVPENISSDMNLRGDVVPLSGFLPVRPFGVIEEDYGFAAIYAVAANNKMADLPTESLLDSFAANTGFSAEDKQFEVDERLEKATKLPSWANKNNLAVSLIRNGQAREAVDLLVSLEKEFPGHYETAANLGTAYELSGEDEKSLLWITEGIKRNPKSHKGSEWLHVKILEAKIAEQKTPGWLTSHSVSGADFGSAPLPSLTPTLPLNNLGQPMTIVEFRDAIKYQVEERIQFVKAPNDIVGDLLFDFANASALTEGPKVAVLALRVAKPFGAPKVKLLNDREKALQSYGLDNPPPSPPRYIATLLFLGLSFAVCGSWVKTSRRIHSRTPGSLSSTAPTPTRWGLLGASSSIVCLVCAALIPILMKDFIGEPSKTLLLVSSVVLFGLHMWGKSLSKQHLWLALFPLALVLFASFMDTPDTSPLFSALAVLAPIGVFYWAGTTGRLEKKLLDERLSAQKATQEQAAGA